MRRHDFDKQSYGVMECPSGVSLTPNLANIHISYGHQIWRTFIFHMDRLNSRTACWKPQLSRLRLGTRPFNQPNCATLVYLLPSSYLCLDFSSITLCGVLDNALSSSVASWHSSRPLCGRTLLLSQREGCHNYVVTLCMLRSTIRVK